jgi:hypothetical protein
MTRKHRYIAKILGFASLILWTSSCNTQKETAIQEKIDKDAPGWMAERPMSSSYYIGIGGASKSKHVIDYVQVAKKNALEDLSGEISVTLDVNSVLFQFEDSKRFKEEYESSIRVQTQQHLEGFEVVDSYETDEEFWVFYRLSKTKWDEIRRQRKDQAIAKSRDLSDRADLEMQELRYDQALRNYFRAFEAIKEYMGEPLEVFTDSGIIYYGNELFNKLNTCMSNIQLNPLSSEIRVVMGRSDGNSKLVVRVENKEGLNLAGIPVTFAYSEKLRLRHMDITDTDGLAEYFIPNITDTRAGQYISVQVDLDKLIQESIGDPVLRRYFSSMNMPEERVDVRVRKPNFLLVSEEVNLGEDMQIQKLSPAARSFLMTNGFEISDDSTKYDYRIEIVAETKAGGTSYNFYSSYLNGQLRIFREGKEVFTHSFHDIKGVQLDYKRAGLDAYDQAVEEMKVLVLPDFLDFHIKN